MLALPEGRRALPDVESVPFPGGVLLVAPHMDDEALGCGALLAGFPWRGSVHVAFATDGARSPERGSGQSSAELPVIRRAEAIEALTVLGVDRSNVHFLDLPDGGLRRHAIALRERLEKLITDLAPAFLLVPFRYDRHPDHLVLNRVAADLVCEQPARAVSLVEYFVYSWWRLLPSGDVRSYLRPEHVLLVEPDVGASRKQCALRCYRSQTTLFYPWQRRPILTGTLLDRVCSEPEIFFVHDPGSFERAVFARAGVWIPVAHRLEPVLKRGKDRVIEWLRR